MNQKQKSGASAFDAIALVIGEQLAEKLVTDLGGLSIWIPVHTGVDLLDSAGPAPATCQLKPETQDGDREAAALTARTSRQAKRRSYGPAWSPTMAARFGILERSVGSEAAHKLVEAFVRDRLIVPFRIDPKRRRRRIVAMHRAGKSVAEIARELKCTERLVWRVLSQPITARPQRRRGRRKTASAYSTNPARASSVKSPG